jgi:hypothetical protein
MAQAEIDAPFGLLFQTFYPDVFSNSKTTCSTKDLPGCTAGVKQSPGLSGDSIPLYFKYVGWCLAGG